LGVFPADLSLTVRELQFCVTENSAGHHFDDWLGVDVSWDIIQLYTQKRGHAVVQLVEALRYKPEGRVFDSRWCDSIFFSLTSFRPHYGPGVDSASNGNEYQECFLEVKAAGV
jgi:hypothetical protein